MLLPASAQASVAPPAPVPVLGLAGPALKLHTAARLSDGSVLVGGERGGRPLAARVRPSGVLEERFGTRGIWSPSWRGVVRTIATAGSGGVLLSVQQAGDWERVSLSPQGKALRRERGVAAPADPAALVAIPGSWARSPDGACLGGLSSGSVSLGRAPLAGVPSGGGPGLLTPQLTASEPARAFTAGARVLSAFALKGAGCGALLADGPYRALVLQRPQGLPRLQKLTAGEASQVASRCLDHVLVFGTRAGGHGRQAVVQAASLPATVRAASAARTAAALPCGP